MTTTLITGANKSAPKARSPGKSYPAERAVVLTLLTDVSTPPASATWPVAPLGSGAGKCQETGLTMEWIRVCCSTSALSRLPRMPNSSMAFATRWMLASTTGPTG